jgi:hypothetical protein
MQLLERVEALHSRQTSCRAKAESFRLDGLTLFSISAFVGFNRLIILALGVVLPHDLYIIKIIFLLI